VYYRCGTTKLAWSAARNSCEAVGMQLARINDANENTAVRAQLAAGTNTWLGGYDVGTAEDNRWVDNGPTIASAGYAPWFTGNPSSAADDCVAIRQADGAWDDLLCTMALDYLCEANLADSPALSQRLALGPSQRFDGNTSASYARDIGAAVFDQA